MRALCAQPASQRELENRAPLGGEYLANCGGNQVGKLTGARSGQMDGLTELFAVPFERAVSGPADGQDHAAGAGVRARHAE